MGWTFFFIMVVLKIPILLLMWIVWWSTPSRTLDGDDDGACASGSANDAPAPAAPCTRAAAHGQASSGAGACGPWSPRASSPPSATADFTRRLPVG